MGKYDKPPVHQAGPGTTEQVTQHVATHYLKKSALEDLLKSLFPNHENFDIKMRGDLWIFTAPKKVNERYP
ncbi:hypothetical protein ACO1O0_006693 [Amphichorda felina]